MASMYKTDSSDENINFFTAFNVNYKQLNYKQTNNLSIYMHIFHNIIHASYSSVYTFTN